MSTLTIKFRAKLDTFAGGQGYKVPDMGAHHVTDMHGVNSIIETDIRQGRMRSLTWWLKRKMNYTLPGVIWENENGVFDTSIEESSQWTITPIGNGFMADITRTFEN